MARFSYIGRSLKGRKSGWVSSPSKREAMQKLREEGIRVLEITEVPESFWTKDISFGQAVRLQDMVIFLRQFSTLLKAGVTVIAAAAILAEQTESKRLRGALQDVERELREGKPLSYGLSMHKDIFPSLFINMIIAGETSGSLDETLVRLAIHFEKQHHTRQKIVSALSYPFAVGIVAFAVIIFLLVSVVPTFVGMFADFGADLPAITRFVLAASQGVQDFWWLLILLGIGIALAIVLLQKNRKTKYYLDYFLLRVPIVGNMLQKAALARMARTLSSLFSSSVPILKAMAIVERVIGNEVMASVVRKSRDSLEKGQSITLPMRKHWAFPPLVTQMILIGEKTGSLDTMLEKVADFYESEVENSSDRLKGLIEPLMILMLAGLVGTIVISIIVPMFEIFNQVGN